MASDSQTTYPGGQKRLDARKITVVKFANANILVAQADSADLADKAIENLQRIAKDIKVEDAEAIPKAVQSAVREVRNYLVDLNKGCSFSDDAWKRFFRDDNAFTLLFGYYFQGNPYLYTIDIDWCLPIPVKNKFKAVGRGAALGEFLLKEFGESSPDFEFGEIISTAVVEKVIENVEGCGRPSWFGIVEHVSDSKAGSDFEGYKKGDIIPAEKKCSAFICQRKTIDAITEELKRQETNSKSKASKHIYNTLTSLCKKIGMLEYSNSNDPDGDGSSRYSGHWKSEKDSQRSMKKFTKKLIAEHIKQTGKKMIPNASDVLLSVMDGKNLKK